MYFPKFTVCQSYLLKIITIIIFNKALYVFAKHENLDLAFKFYACSYTKIAAVTNNSKDNFFVQPS